MLSFLTDTLLIIVGILGSIYYTSLIGIIVLAGWFLLEWRRARIRKRYRPLVVYPAIKLSWVLVLAVLGIIGFILWDNYVTWISDLGILAGVLVLVAWWFVSLRVFKYQRGRAKMKAMAKPVKRAVKRKAVKRKPVKKAVKKKAKKKAPKKKKAVKKKAKRKPVKKKATKKKALKKKAKKKAAKKKKKR